MANFPQSFEPVNSDSILEQFLQLKGNVNKVNTAMVDVEQTADSAFEKSSNNESSIQVLENNVQTLSTGLETAEQNLSKCVRFDAQSLTDAQKAQARANIGAGSAMATTVLVNGVAQTQIQFDSDPQTQIDSTKSEISALNSRVETAEDSITTNAGAISALDEKALKTPMTAPTENEIPTINTANAQVNVTVGNGLKIETNELKVDNNIIQDKLTAGNGISIENGVIKVDQNVLNSIDNKETIAGLNAVNISNTSFSSLRDCLSYLASDLTKTYYCYIGDAESSSFKNLVGNPTGFGNYTLCLIKPIGKLTNQNVGIYTGSVYQCIAVGTIVNKLAIGYIFNAENAINETTFSGWKVLF